MRSLQQWSRPSSRHADEARRARLPRRALPPWLRRMLRERIAPTGAVLLPPALLLLYVFCHSHANWESWLASLRELDHDHGAPARELGRALSLARSLRGRQAPDAALWRTAVQLAADRVSAGLAARWRSPARLMPSPALSPLMPLVPLVPLLAMFGWLH
ncbi:hypothetical protein [Cupriavidus sp. IK-TO18]|uniref:hypothetical protein n=1 Tax=Cupriavidus sp. IK-TO18 TaxID=2782182 RepID=UPI002105D63A|nr:hypothetical protein [Cupriavidus sp. IK-TO18]